MKKVVIMFMVVGSMAMAAGNCLGKDYSDLIKNRITVLKLKESKNALDKAKYNKAKVNILAEIAHINKEHSKELSAEQKLNLLKFTKEFN